MGKSGCNGWPAVGEYGGEGPVMVSRWWGRWMGGGGLAWIWILGRMEIGDGRKGGCTAR
jgi:hypothetical protein